MAVLYEINGKKVLFIHIPKTGGGFLHNILKKFECPSGKSVGGHPTYEEIILMKGKEFVDDCDYIITIVRNPYNKVYSFYNYISKYSVHEHGHRNEKDAFKHLSFNEHTKLFNSGFNFSAAKYHKNSTSSPYLYTKHQIDFIKGVPQEKLFIIKLENIQNDLSQFLNKINSTHILNNVDFNKKFRQSTYTDDINQIYTEESMEIVYKYFQDDFLKFDYSK